MQPRHPVAPFNLPHTRNLSWQISTCCRYICSFDGPAVILISFRELKGAPECQHLQSQESLGTLSQRAKRPLERPNIFLKP